MGTAVYTTFRGRVRIYDGSIPPRYLVIPYVQADLRAIMARARPAMTLRMNRGVGDQFMHYTREDDGPIFEPLVGTFSAWMDEQYYKHVVNALCNPYDLATWSVGTSTFVTTAGTGQSILNGASSLVPVPQMTDDATHRRVTVEFLWVGKVAGTNDMGFRYEECYFPRDQNTINDGNPTVHNFTFWCYGKPAQITSFTSGTDITPVMV